MSRRDGRTVIIADPPLNYHLHSREQCYRVAGSCKGADIEKISKIFEEMWTRRMTVH